MTMNMTTMMLTRTPSDHFHMPPWPRTREEAAAMGAGRELLGYDYDDDDDEDEDEDDDLDDDDEEEGGDFDEALEEKRPWWA